MMDNESSGCTTNLLQGLGPVHTISFSLRVLHFILTDIISPDQMNFRSEEERMSNNCEKDAFVQELHTLAKELEFEPRIHMVKLDNYAQIIEAGIPTDGLVLNLCDGSDVDGVPGPCVARYLEARGYSAIVGCDSLFILNTLTKHGMKELFVNYFVSTPLGFCATPSTDLALEAGRLVYPLFVKISDSYGSVGIDDSNVCHNLDQLRAKCTQLFKSFVNLIVEEYIDGEEYSVLVLGNCRDSEQPVIVYPPAERYFPETLDRYQRFVSFDRNWGGEKGDSLYYYRSVSDPADAAAIQDLSRRAYAAVSGNAYGRVDIRRREVNGKFYVLEVNASCGLGFGSSSEKILELASHRTKDFIQILINNVLKHQEERRVLIDGGSAGTRTPSPAKNLRNASPTRGSSIMQEEFLTSSIPTIVESRVARLMSQPSISVLPNPVIQVIVSAVLVNQTNVENANSSAVIDPEGRLAYTWGKDAEYISELETILRAVGYDAITHIYQMDDIEGVLQNLKPDDLIFNACFGQEGKEISRLLQRGGFQKTVGVNVTFMQQSSSRLIVKQLLESSRLKTAASFALSSEMKFTDIEERLASLGMEFPVYAKPVLSKRYPHGHHSGRTLYSIQDLEQFYNQCFSKSDSSNGKSWVKDEWLVEEFLEGTWYLALVAGDARNPNADVIVLPPIEEIRTINHAKPLQPVVSGNGSSREDRTALGTPVSTSSMSSLRDVDDILLKMDIQDLARRAFVAVHGSCYGLVHIVQTRDDDRLFVAGVSGDVRFGQNAKSFRVLEHAGLDTNALFHWLLHHPVKA